MSRSYQRLAPTLNDLFKIVETYSVFFEQRFREAILTLKTWMKKKISRRVKGFILKNEVNFVYSYSTNCIFDILNPLSPPEVPKKI